MIVNPHVPLQRLVLSLSEGIDSVTPEISNHQLRVAYITTRIAQTMGFDNQKLQDIFHAAALHDIGLLRAENKVRAVKNNDLEGLGWHGEAGYLLLKDNEFFDSAAGIVRYHHTYWNYGQGESKDGNEIPFASHIVLLADTVDREIKRDIPILHQSSDITQRIVDGNEIEFHPECVRAFLEVSSVPAFWLDANSNRIYSILNNIVDWPTFTIDEMSVGSIGHIFAQVVDAMSPWTACHTAGVSAIAEQLAIKMNFSPREQALMKTAGYLHDLGKITVPSRILDKEGKLDKEEWAIMKGHTYYTFRILDTIGGMPQIAEWAGFHHERLDGKGYPFGHSANDLTLGARIMAVADITGALTENRPYRQGMNKQQALGVLNNMVSEGAIDGDIVAALTRGFDEINDIRVNIMNEYSVKQRQLTDLLDITADGFYTIK